MRDSFALILKADMSENTSVSGLRVATRVIIIKEFCTFVTSVLSLVTRLAVENLSMFEKEKFCTL